MAHIAEYGLLNLLLSFSLKHVWAMRLATWVRQEANEFMRYVAGRVSHTVIWLPKMAAAAVRIQDRTLQDRAKDRTSLQTMILNESNVEASDKRRRIAREAWTLNPMFRLAMRGRSIRQRG